MLVAGFQGVSTAADVTTLGRGGSDTTAVAVAAALNAEMCEIYTDVAGVYSADPRIVADARRLPIVSFEEMLEMAASGARVLQLRSVEYARNHDVRIHCRSSFEDGPGTVVLSERETMERPLITAVTHSTDEARVTLLGVPDRPGVAGRIFGALAETGVNVDMIIQNEPLSDGSRADMSFCSCVRNGVPDLKTPGRLGLAQRRSLSTETAGLVTVTQVCVPPVLGTAMGPVRSTPSISTWNVPPGPDAATRALKS